jgi:hypothetical protein
MDADIQRNCDGLLRTLPLAPDMIDSKGNFPSYSDKKFYD